MRHHLQRQRQGRWHEVGTFAAPGDALLAARLMADHTRTPHRVVRLCRGRETLVGVMHHPRDPQPRLC